MKQRSPTLEGFRAVLKQPSLGLAEVAWRWSFGGAAAALCAVAFFEYLDTLTVTRGDLLLLRTRHPALVAHALSRIFAGSAGRVVATMIVLAFCMAIGWTLVAALARAATVKALLDYFSILLPSPDAHDRKRPPEEWRLGSLLELNFFRAMLTLAAAVGVLAAFIVGGAASPAEHPSPGTAFLIMLGIAGLVWFVWSVLNWFLSLAAIFAVRDGRDFLASIAATIDLCRDHAGSMFAVGTWFGLAHFAAFCAATTLVAFPISLAGVLPPAAILGGVLLVTLLYFALADYLYMGRLAAYVAIAEFPGATVTESPNALPPAGIFPRTDAVDPDELILGDLPAPI